MRLTVASGVLAAVVASAAAGADADMQHPDPLRGRMFIAGATLVDPPGNEPHRSHAYFEIAGDSARHMFEAMIAPAVPDECVPGRRLKRAANLVCSVGRHAQDARCEFAIDLRSGSLAVGSVC